MAYTTLLHSGEFVDYDGNTITVEFFKKIDLNANPTSLSFSDAGGSRSLVIWSRDGDAKLYDPTVDWLSYTVPSNHAVPVVGTDYYKYTYIIHCNSNSGDERTTNLHIGIEGMGGVIIDVPVTQSGE